MRLHRLISRIFSGSPIFVHYCENIRLYATISFMQVLKCTRKNLDPAWVKNEIQKILKILIKTAPHKIYLFGSANENRMTDQSDFDFLLVFESSALIREGQKNLRPFYPLSEFSVDLVWTTEDEFEKKKRLGGICFVVHNEGTLLYERKQNQ